MFQNFVQTFLCLDPESRPSADVALQHVFLQQGHVRSDVEDIWIKKMPYQRIKKQIKQYRKELRLKENDKTNYPDINSQIQAILTAPGSSRDSIPWTDYKYDWNQDNHVMKSAAITESQHFDKSLDSKRISLKSDKSALTKLAEKYSSNEKDTPSEEVKETIEYSAINTASKVEINENASNKTLDESVVNYTEKHRAQDSSNLANKTKCNKLDEQSDELQFKTILTKTEHLCQKDEIKSKLQKYTSNKCAHIDSCIDISRSNNSTVDSVAYGSKEKEIKEDKIPSKEVREENLINSSDCKYAEVGEDRGGEKRGSKNSFIRRFTRWANKKTMKLKRLFV